MLATVTLIKGSFLILDLAGVGVRVKVSLGVGEVSHVSITPAGVVLASLVFLRHRCLEAMQT